MPCRQKAFVPVVHRYTAMATADEPLLSAQNGVNTKATRQYGSVDHGPGSLARQLQNTVGNRGVLHVTVADFHAIDSNRRCQRLVDVTHLKQLLAQLRGECCPGLVTPNNSPETSGSPIVKIRSRQKSVISTGFNQPAFMTSCSVPGDGSFLAHYKPERTFPVEGDASGREEERESDRGCVLESDQFLNQRQEFLAELNSEVDTVLEHIHTRLAILKHHAENLPEDRQPNLGAPGFGIDLPTEEEDVDITMLSSPMTGTFDQCVFKLKQALRVLTETLSINMSYVYRLVLEYDKSLGLKEGGQYYREQQPRVVNCMQKIGDVVFYLDEQITLAEEARWKGREGDVESEEDELLHLKTTGRGRYFLCRCIRNVPILLHLCMFLLTLGLLTVIVDSAPSTVAFYRLFRGPAIIILFMYMISFNVVVWQLYGIKYRSMFQFGKGVMPTARELADYAGLFAVCFTVLAAAFFISLGVNAAQVWDKIIPCVMWGVILLALFNPLKFMHHKGRFALVKSLLRILTAPFHKITFGDFWLADQLNSLAVVFLAVEYSACYVTWDWRYAPDSQVCGSKTFMGIRPLLSALPAMFRFWQCLRDYYDSGKVQHFLNAIKYSTTFWVVLTATLYSLHYPSGYPVNGEWDTIGKVYLGLWFVASCVRALYTFVWDVNRDWGLWRTLKKRHFLLREDLVYERPWIYHCAIVVDFILRFSQTLKISLGVYLHVSSDLLFTTLAVAEVFRRFIWNFFRVEFQHVINMYNAPTVLVQQK